MSSQSHDDHIRRRTVVLSRRSQRNSYVADTRPLGGRIKRCIDIGVAVFALLAFSPLFALIAISIRLLDGRPTFYQHHRVGFNRQSFKCIKFRTMINNSDQVLDCYLRERPDAAGEWLTTRKLRNDPRTTPLGTVLRKLSLDELPQLINVLRGDMSIVGPRPIIEDEIKKYGSDAQYYFRVRPGITGDWQVNGRTDHAYDGRIALDRAYVENWSVRKDIYIMLKTVPAVLTTKGSY